MTMYFVGIDISKYKHDCCIISAADQKVVSKFTFKNDKSGFEQLNLILNSLSTPEDIKIGFESTAHYALNLELFLENANHSFMEINPVLIKDFTSNSFPYFDSFLTSVPLTAVFLFSVVVYDGRNHCKRHCNTNHDP